MKKYNKWKMLIMISQSPKWRLDFFFCTKTVWPFPHLFVQKNRTENWSSARFPVAPAAQQAKVVTLLPVFVFWLPGTISRVFVGPPCADVAVDIVYNQYKSSFTMLPYQPVGSICGAFFSCGSERVWETRRSGRNVPQCTSHKHRHQVQKCV